MSRKSYQSEGKLKIDETIQLKHKRLQKLRNNTIQRKSRIFISEEKLKELEKHLQEEVNDEKSAKMEKKIEKLNEIMEEAQESVQAITLE